MIKLIISEQTQYLKNKLDKYIDSVIEERNDFNYCFFDFELTPLAEIIDSLESPAFGSDKKIVVCKNPYFIKDEKKKLEFDNDLTDLINYLKNPNPDSDLIIICNQNYYIPKNKIVNLIQQTGEINNYLLDNENDFINYGNSLIKSSDISISNDARSILFERCMGDVCKLENEIDKLSEYHKEINAELADKFISRPLEDDIFELSNALMNKDHKRIMKIYSDLKLLKIEPINLISMLAGQYRIILQTIVLKKNYYSEEEISKYLNIHPYRIKLASKYANQYGLNEIKQILIELSNLDVKIKSGELDRYVDFELFLATK